MESDHGGHPDRKPGLESDLHQPYREAMTDTVHPVIRRYADGGISAMQAASELGGRATVADVLVMLRQAGLKPPQPPPEQERRELAHARRVLGLDQA